MKKIIFKQSFYCGHKQKNQYYIYDKSIRIGEISFIKKDNFFIIGFLGIYQEFQKQGYGYKIIEHILSNYSVKAIVGETIYKSRGFWNKCIKKYNGTRKNISILNNCSSSFIIPKVYIDKNILYNYLELSTIIE